MLKEERVDIKESTILNLSKEILEILLVDRTTNKNIIWITQNILSIEKVIILKVKLLLKKLLDIMEM